MRAFQTGTRFLSVEPWSMTTARPLTSLKPDADGAFRFGSCFAQLQGAELALGNDHIERLWQIGADGHLTALSFVDKSVSQEWLVPPAELPPGGDAAMTVSVGRVRVTEAEALVVTLEASQRVVYRFQVFPDARGILIQMTVPPAPPAPADLHTSDDAVAAPTGVELLDREKKALDDERSFDALENLTLAPLHLTLTQITLHDQTDRHNELVFENEWRLHTAEGPLALPGCLFHVEDVLTKNGLIFFKAAPLPSARPEKSPFDLAVKPAVRQFTLTGQGLDESVGGEGYPFAIVAYTGGKVGRITAWQQFQRQMRTYDPARDGLLVSNTWGDRGRDGRVNESFLQGEIRAGKRLGVEVVQIDDGWQRGVTANSLEAKAKNGVWEGFYAADTGFWRAHPARFPLGLEPLIAAAKETGLRFGLWFAPDSADDFAHWQTDADTLLHLYETHGVAYVKIDGVKLRTKTGEQNLRRFFHRVLEGSDGNIVFDNDVTAEVRPGYFGLIDAGPLFVENRYTDWNRYWPHATLRNLWKLAPYVDPVRLRMEWLNHARNTDKYENDPLAPAAYRPDYLFATVMFSSPLGWFETQNLPQSYFDEAAPLIAIWKQHREAIFSGTIIPLGDAPDGTTFTGFASVAHNRRSAYILMFREKTDEVVSSLAFPYLDLPSDTTSVSGEILAGQGNVNFLRTLGGSLETTIPSAQAFVFARIVL